MAETIYCKDESNKTINYFNINVGDLPKPVENFTCLFENFKKMTCSFDFEENFMSTQYHVEFRLYENASEIYICNGSAEPECPQKRCRFKCIVELGVSKILPSEFYYFKIYGENKLGKSGVREFKVDQFESVFLARPTKLEFHNVTSNSVGIFVEVEDLLKFTNFGALDFDVEYRSDCNDWSNTEIAVRKTGNVKYEIQMGLKYAYLKHEVRVRIQTAKASRAKLNRWSGWTTNSFKTLKRNPDTPPDTNHALFYKTKDSFNIYWKNVPHCPGDNISYLISYRNETKKVIGTQVEIEIPINEIIKIWSQNDAGLSENYSTIIPYEFDPSLNPKNIRKYTIIQNNKIQIFWNPPENSTVESYTVFWCPLKTPKLKDCLDSVDFVNVAGTANNYTIENVREYLNIAIAANLKNSSSGLVWFSCLGETPESIGPLVTFELTSEANAITAIWSLECEDRSLLKEYLIR